MSVNVKLVVFAGTSISEGGVSSKASMSIEEEHPLMSVYVIVDVPPLTAVTTPVEVIVATSGLELVHADEGAGVPAPVSVVVKPTVMLVFPVIKV